MPGPVLPPFLLSQAVGITFAAGIFIGLYLVSVAYANRWLLFTDDGWRFKSRKSIHWYILAITNIFMVLVLIGQAVNVNTSIAEAAFVEQGNNLSDYRDPFWKGMVKCVVSSAIVLLADTVLMYRVWITDMGRLRALWFPIFLWLGGIVCTSLEIFVFVKGFHDHDPNFGPYRWAKVNMDVGPGIIAIPFVGSTILLNAYCTGFLVWRIGRVLKYDTKSEGSRQLRVLVRILMESGFLYFSISVAKFVAFFNYDNFAIHMIGTLNTVIIGIAYNLIIIRVGQTRAEDECRMSNSKLTSFRFADLNPESCSDSANSAVIGEMTEVARDKADKA